MRAVHIEYAVVAALMLVIWGAVTRLESRIFTNASIWQSNQTWFALTWVVGAILLALPIYLYPEQFTESALIYVIAIHTCFAAGGTAALVFPIARRGVSDRPLVLTKKLLLILLLLGIFGQTVKTMDSYLSSSFGFFERLDVSNLKVLKEEYVDPTRASAFGNVAIQMSLVFTGAGQVALIAFAFGYFRRQPWARSSRLLRNLAFVFVFSMGFSAWFGDGSRLGLVMAALMVCLPLYMRTSSSHEPPRVKKPLTPRKLLIFGAVVSGVLFLSVVFLGGRIGGVDAFLVLKYTHRATIDPVTMDLVGDDAVLRALVLQASYLTTGLPTLSYYLGFPNWPFTPGFGAMNFGPAFILFGRFFGYESAQIQQTYIHMGAPLVDAGYYANIWATMTRELLVDFGSAGALAFYFFLGFLANRLRMNYVVNGTIEVGVLWTLVRIQLIWSGLHSLMYHQYFGYALLVAVALYMLLPFAKRRQLIAVTS